jgi:hypothetical protein
MAGSLGFGRQYCIPTSKAPAGHYFASISPRGAKIPVPSSPAGATVRGSRTRLCNTRRFFRSGTAQYSNAHECFTPPHLRAMLLRWRIAGTNPIFAVLCSICGIELAGRRKVAGIRWASRTIRASRTHSNRSTCVAGCEFLRRTRLDGCRRLAPKQSLVAILPAATVPKTLHPHRRAYSRTPTGATQ